MLCMVISHVVQENLHLTQAKSPGEWGSRGVLTDEQLPGRLRTHSQEASL